MESLEPFTKIKKNSSSTRVFRGRGGAQLLERQEVLTGGNDIRSLSLRDETDALLANVPPRHLTRLPPRDPSELVPAHVGRFLVQPPRGRGALGIGRVPQERQLSLVREHLGRTVQEVSQGLLQGFSIENFQQVGVFQHHSMVRRSPLRPARGGERRWAQRSAMEHTSWIPALCALSATLSRICSGANPYVGSRSQRSPGSSHLSLGSKLCFRRTLRVCATSSSRRELSTLSIFALRLKHAACRG